MIRMRPHTRTQCQDDGNQCPECRETPTSTSSTQNTSSTSVASNAASAAASSAASVTSSNKNDICLGHPGLDAISTGNQTGSSTSGSGLDPHDLFLAPIGTVSKSRSSIAATSGSAASLASKLLLTSKTEAGNAGGQGKARAMLFVELPAEILFKILNYMSFKEISHLRMVSRRFNEICASMLNSTFQRLQSQMLSRLQDIKTQMPRRESARRNHPLAQECDVVETLHMRLSLLQMTFGKHIERKHMCFFAGEILDEVQRIMRYIRHTPNQHIPKRGSAYIFMEDEVFDLTTMAMEYFKEHIEPTLPEITYFGADFLDFTSFATPTKRRSVSGSTSVLGSNCLDSPCSSRASVAGSSVSEAWSTASTAATGEVLDMDTVASVPAPPQSNMVLRKRIRRIRQGMKRYNDQLVEVKKELKTCKTKMETQSKQVHEYSQRLEDYDKKFEESSRKFQTLLTELNKCKTELQYWRSKSTTLLALPSTCASCSAPLLPTQSAEDAEAELKALANQGILMTDKDLSETNTCGGSPEVQKQPLQPPCEESHYLLGATASTSSGLNPPSPITRGTGASSSKSGPPSPVSAVGRKRRSRDVDYEEFDVDSKRKNSLRGASSGSSGGAKNTRFKRPKTSLAN